MPAFAPSRFGRIYGWKPGLPTREIPRLELTSYPVLAATASLMTTGFLPPVWDQLTTGSCTGHGCTAAKMYARAKQVLPFLDLSRLFPYWNGRVIEGSQTSDSGAVIADVISALLSMGDCPYADLPTDPSLIITAPSSQAFSDALAHKALAATRVWGSSGAGLEYHTKHCISVLGLPVVYGITVYESFESDAVTKTGIVPIPKPDEDILGGHCVLAVAYNDSTRMVHSRNSWGPDWGQAGYFDIPYDYIFNPDYSSDFHAITLES